MKWLQLWVTDIKLEEKNVGSNRTFISFPLCYCFAVWERYLITLSLNFLYHKWGEKSMPQKAVGCFMYIEHQWLWQCCLVAKLCATLCHPMDRSLPGSFIHGILQARILGWVAISSSRGSSWPRDGTLVSCLGRQVLTEPPGNRLSQNIGCWNGGVKKPWDQYVLHPKEINCLFKVFVH